jgi:hypothetical protein
LNAARTAVSFARGCKESGHATRHRAAIAPSPRTTPCRHAFADISVARCITLISAGCAAAQLLRFIFTELTIDDRLH